MDFCLRRKERELCRNSADFCDKSHIICWLQPGILLDFIVILNRIIGGVTYMEHLIDIHS